MSAPSDSNPRTVPVAVFGGRGSGALAAWSLARSAASGGQQRFAGYLNDQCRPGETIDGERVLGPFGAWRELAAETLFLAPLHKVRQSRERYRLIGELAIPAQRWTSVIDPSAALAPSASHGAGCFLAHNATVSPAARLGAHVAVRVGAYLGHDTTIGDFVFVGGNAVVCGYTEIGEGSYIAPGAVIREELRIGRHCIIGMGAVVTRDVPDFSIVTGKPGRIVGTQR